MKRIAIICALLAGALSGQMQSEATNAAIANGIRPPQVDSFTDARIKQEHLKALQLENRQRQLQIEQQAVQIQEQSNGYDRARQQAQAQLDQTPPPPAPIPRVSASVNSGAATVELQRPKPGDPGFKTYEDYIEALVEWKVLALGQTPPQKFQIVQLDHMISLPSELKQQTDVFRINMQTGETWLYLNAAASDGLVTRWKKIEEPR